MSKKYIDAEALKTALHRKYAVDCHEENWFDDLMEQIVGTIDEQPYADVAEVKHGRWCLTDTPVIREYCVRTAFRCSACGKAIWQTKYARMHEMHYCPMCGALMDDE